MKKELSRKWSISRNWLCFFSIILLVIGVFYRFVNLDKKIYWGDEVFTSLRISGYTVPEMDRQLRNGRLISIEDLQKYQYPNLEKKTIDTIKGLASEESQVVPLYFVILRFWVEWFGNSVAVTRSFSAFISLLTFPCLYWLCQVLFESSLIGWIAIAFVAISPVHVLYAQEARAYSLWIVAILISSATLLRAMRFKTKFAWLIYAATLSLGFYSQLFFGFVALGQGIYVVAIEGFRLTKILISYLLSLLAGFVIFLPWVFVMITNPAPQTVSWTDTKQTFFASATRWAGIVSRGFLDLGVAPGESGKLKIALIPFILIIFALTIYSIYVLCRRTDKRVWLFVLTLSGSVALPLMLVDFVLEKRYGTTRYILPSILGIQLAVAYLFTTKITSIYTSVWQKKLWSFLAFMVIISGVLSCTLMSQSRMWWNKVPEINQQYPQVADIIVKANKPLLISDANIIQLQVLGHLVEPKVRFQFVAKGQIPKITYGFTDVFLFDSSDFLKAGVEKVYNSKLEQIDKLLWKIRLPT
ncbi:glycosyltransferase family 39 protein [Tolypothrix sp. VBCCA 56010]|uniref:glycosyltransferase family 39 protein n=1 Tax=Tolypothrix sp. VBCCA 56010 TaxID=3137731 RepID=UPI003D7EDB18